MWIPNFGPPPSVNINVNQAGSAESAVNGVSLNMISQEGGTHSRARSSAPAPTDDWQSDNFTQRVQESRPGNADHAGQLLHMNLS